MTSWNEDNFLERLMPILRRNAGAEENSCPDAETLYTVMEGDASGPLREAIVEHVMQCPACAELHSRLLNFNKGSLPEREGEWKEAQKRLDNWLAEFLSSDAVASRPLEQAKACGPVLWWKGISRAAPPWKMRWAFGVAAVFVLVIAGVLIVRRKSALTPQVQIAARTTVPQEPTTNPAPAQELVERPNSERRIGQESKAAMHTAPSTANVLTAKAQDSGGLRKAGGLREPQAASSLPSSGASSTPPTQTAEAYTPSLPNVRQSSSISSRIRSSVPAKAPSMLSTTLAPRPSAPASSVESHVGPKVVTEHPAYLRFEAGTRLWIRLNSVKRQPDGSFTFQGSLLLPVNRANEVLIDRGTEVNGSGSVIQGRTSLFITELVVQGARYILSGATGATDARPPGTGGAVQFDAGQVLEMWLASASTYEKAPDMDLQPQHRK